MLQHVTSLAGKARQLRVLLVEDDDIDAQIVELMAGLLRHYRLSVTRVATMERARAEIVRDIYDLVLVDYWLDGRACDPLLALMAGLPRRPATILISGMSPADMNRMAPADRRLPFLSKLVLSPDTFERAIDGALAEYVV